MKYKIKADRMCELERFGFEQASYNEMYLIRYIPNTYYSTIYIDNQTRELYVYDDYNDTRIDGDEYIKDLVQADMVEEDK